MGKKRERDKASGNHAGQRKRFHQEITQKDIDQLLSQSTTKNVEAEFLSLLSHVSGSVTARLILSFLSKRIEYTETFTKHVIGAMDLTNENEVFSII